jgi:hypothetical protein
MGFQGQKQTSFLMQKHPNKAKNAPQMPNFEPGNGELATQIWSAIV